MHSLRLVVNIGSFSGEMGWFRTRMILKGNSSPTGGRT